MKNKKAIIILTVLILIFMISGVSASDINTTDSEAVSTTLQDIDSVDESTENLYDNNEVLSVSDDSTVQNDSDTENSRSDTTDMLKSIGSVENENNIDEEIIIENKNSNNNPELLSATNNDILGDSAIVSITINSADISSITVSATVILLKDIFPRGSFLHENIYCDGSPYAISFQKSNNDPIEHVTSSITISGPFKSGSHTVSFYEKSDTATVSKASPSGISASISDNYNYGATGTYTYSGTVNGKVGSVTLAGYVYIYKDGSLWKTVSCNANGAFSYSWSSTDLSVGSHTFDCYYGGNDYYNSYGSSSNRQGSKSITVSKGNPQITISRTVNTNIYPGKVTVTFTVKNLKGDVLSGITLTPGGNKFTSSAISTDSSGKATFTITPLDAGTYSDWTVTTTANTNYNSVVSSAVSSFTINKQVPTVEYTLNNLSDVYPGVRTVSLTLTDSEGHWLSGFTVSASGTGFTSMSNVTDNVGRVYFNMPDLDAKTYSDWKFTVGATDNFAALTVNVPEFVILPYNVSVIIDDTLSPAVSIYESTVTLTGCVCYPSNAPYPKGRVYLTLGDITSSGVVQDDGTFTVEFTGVKPGFYYNVSDVYFQPDSQEKNYVSSVKETFNIKRVIIYQSDSYISDLEVLAKDNNFTYGNRITVTGSIIGNGRYPTGNVTLYVDGNLNKVYGSYCINILDDGKFTFTVNNAPAGNHYFTVVYEGDEYYYDSSNNTGGFEVGSAEMNFETISTVDGVYNGNGNSAYVNVSVSANGEGDVPRGQIRVNLSDNSRSWTAPLNGNNSVVYISNLAVGTYDVSVEYVPAGDEKNYNPRVALNTYTISVSKGVPDFTIEAPGVGLGEDAYIYINLPNDAQGNVVLNVRGDIYKFNLTNNPNNRTLKLSSPGAGAYKITASYSGDSNWKGYSEGLDDFNTTLYVERPGASVAIDVNNISYGMDAVINFTIYSKSGFQDKARGAITVYGLGKEEGYEVEVINGKAQLTVSGLAMGTYNVVAYYGGYNDLMGNINVSSFKVNGHDTDMILNLNSSSMDVDSSILLTVTLESDINDPVYLYVDGERCGVSVADNGVARFILSGQTISSLTIGTHNITAVFMSSEKYNGVSNNTTFTVNKIRPVFDVSVVSDSNHNIIFNIFVGDDATGIITVTGNGTSKKFLVDDGYAEYTLTGLHTGVYTFNITYSGDDNYDSISVNRSVDSVKFSDYTMVITNTEAAQGKSPTVYVSVPVQLNGKTVKLYVNNDSVPLIGTVVDGVATFSDASIISTTSIFVKAVYEGDDYWDAKSVNKTIPVDKIGNYTLDIILPEIIYVGDNITLRVNTENDIGLVNITVNGIKYEINPNNGYTIYDIDEGTYNVVVSYCGDNVYYYKHTNLTFNSIKRNTDLNVSVGSVIYGNPVTISINITDKTTGIILVTMDGKEYRYIDISDHNIILTDSDISVGPHTLVVSYVGDRIYNPVQSGVYDFSVFKNNTFNFDASVNGESIINGGSVTRKDEDTFIFEVALPDDASGVVNITIKKADTVVFDGFIKLPNNMISIPISDFGTYSVCLNYSGDSNYDSKIILFNLISDSNKVIPSFDFDTVKTGTLYSNVSGNVLYVVSTNYNGPVELYIDGVFYSDVLISGNEGQIILPCLAAGSHLFTLNYNGNQNYMPYNIDNSFSIVKKVTKTTICVDEGRVSELTNISISIRDNNDVLISDASGYAFVNISGETQLIEVKNGMAVLNIVYLTNGTRNINVDYKGDSRYDSSSKNTQFSVNKFQTSISVSEQVVALNGNLTVLVNYTDAGGELEITLIDGYTQVLPVVDGVAILNELPLVNGTYSAVINYKGDWKYDACLINVAVTVNKVSGIIISVPGNVTIDDMLNITVGDDSCDGNLKVKIGDGEEFIIPVTMGVAVIPVDKLPPVYGDYDINLYYYDGSYWENSEYNTTFHADKITVYPFNISSPVIRFGENATLEINLPDDVNAELLVKINGEDKNVNIADGKGKLENISGLHAGLNSVEAVFGSGKYETSTAVGTILVNPNDMTLDIILPDNLLYVDQSATITVKANVTMNNNVTVYVNGVARSLKLNNGEGSFTIDSLAYGKYVFTAIFAGNENYTYTAAAEKSFTVDKINVTLNVTTSDVVVGHPVTINVNINGDATGLVIIKVDNNQYSLNLDNKEYTLTLPSLGNGTHAIAAKYYGDNKYYGYENYTSINITKLTPEITISDSILIGEDFVINMRNTSSLVGLPNGKLVFAVDGYPEVTIDINNGAGVVEASSLPDSDNQYFATLHYLGDNNYYSLTERVSFIISKVPELVIITPANVTIDDVMTIKVGDASTDGKLNITIGNGEEFTVSVVNGVATVPVEYLPQESNLYAMTLSYYDGSYWNDVKVVRNFHADKITSYEFSISDDTIRFTENATLYITLPDDVNATLTIKINDVDKTVKITNGRGTLENINGLHAGLNTVVSEFVSGKYETSTATSFIQVDPNDITLEIIVPAEQLYVDESATVTVKANVTMNNDVTVYVNGKAQTLKLNNGEGSFTIGPLVYGDYVFTTIFNGNENFTYATASEKSFSVAKRSIDFNISVNDILVSEDEIITVTIDKNVTGQIIFNINGIKYVEDIADGIVVLNVAGLKFGTYKVVADYMGDHKYLPSQNTTTFDVNKNPIGEIVVRSLPIKNNATTVTVTVGPVDATGYVIIEVNNESFAAKLLDGKTQIEVTNLTAGENPFNITYVGDDKYLSNMTNGVIVNRGICIESEVNVTAEDIMVDGRTKISISVLEDATGYVLLVVDGNSIRLPIVDAKAEFTMGNFKAGTYNVTVTYLGDEKYYNSTNTTSFEVCRYANDITVEVADGVAGSPVAVNVIGDNADATGDVTITVDGVNYTAAMKEGVASFNVTIEKSGNFEVVAKYGGDNYYDESFNANSFDLANAIVVLNITAEDMIIGDDAIIIVKLPSDATGNVTLSLKTTRTVYSSPIVDGVACFEISGLSAGTYYLTADYAGDIKYAAVSDDNVSFIVAKKNTGSMTNFDVNTDDNGTNVIVTVPENATGNVTIIVGDKVVTSPIVNGTAVISLGNLTGDTYATISYLGDDVYGGFNETAVISAGNIKVISKLTIETVDIYVGENANIVVSVPDDATGNIVLNVNGKDYAVAISNGKATFSIVGLGNGTHAVAAYFNGDDKYLKSENTSSITVNKLVPGIAVSADNINVGNATNIVVEVPTDATGIVEITIGAESYSATVSGGKAVFAINGLADGTYAVSAAYLGDAKYLTNSSSANFNVSKNNIGPVGDNKSGISSEVIDNKTVITVDLPDDATGYVNITVDNKTYTNIPVVNGTASFPLDNVSENANISVAYSGDDKYDGFVQNATVTDDGIRLEAPIVMKSDKTAYAAGDTAVIVATLPADATGKLIIKANGEVIFEGEGTAIVNYVIPAGGEFNIEAVYTGDKKYAPVSNSIRFSANKTNSTASISVEDTPFDENVTVVVSVPADATGNVTITVEGVDYVANVSDGKAIFSLPRLGIGKYSVDAVYNGDAKYESSVDKVEFDVVLKVVTSDILWGENATVSVLSPAGTRGMITISCEKTTFVVDINDTVMNFTFADLLPGDHTVTVVYDMVADGYQATVNKVFNVARLACDVSVNVGDVIVGNDVVIHVSVNSTGPVDGGVVYVIIDGKIYNATVANGTADIVIAGLGVGKYENVAVTYNGTQFVAPSVKNTTFNVNVLPVNLIGGKNINVFYLEGAKYSIRVVDLNGAPLSGIKVTFKVAGKNYDVVSDANGYAVLKLNLKPGSYKITASANGKSVSNNIKVKSIIVAKKTTKVKKKAKKTIIKITVKGHKVKQTSKVKFTYKGKNKVKVKFGKGMKKQTISVKFKGKTYKVKVKGKGVGRLKLAKKVAKKLKKGKKYTLKVTYKGPKLYKKAKLTVKFKGKKYKVKTNKLGVAKFKVTKKMVKKLKKGKKVKYTITYKQNTVKRFVKIK